MCVWFTDRQNVRMPSLFGSSNSAMSHDTWPGLRIDRPDPPSRKIDCYVYWLHYDTHTHSRVALSLMVIALKLTFLLRISSSFEHLNLFQGQTHSEPMGRYITRTWLLKYSNASREYSTVPHHSVIETVKMGKLTRKIPRTGNIDSEIG